MAIVSRPEYLVITCLDTEMQDRLNAAAAKGYRVVAGSFAYCYGNMLSVLLAIAP